MTAAAAQHPQPPSKLLGLAEIHRALFELSVLPVAAPLLNMAPRGDGHPVLVLPGFLAGDLTTVPLRRYLRGLGYRVFSWDLGSNFGPRTIGERGEHLEARLRSIHEECGEEVSLVGWSLGGVMARLMAGRFPKMVRQVITLGSPFTGDPRATNVWRIYERVSGQKVGGDAARIQLRETRGPLSVPSTAIYSRTDGVVSWRNCVEPESATRENIQVYGSHCGLGVNPAVLFAVADRLSLPKNTWNPFDRSGWRKVFYPTGPQYEHASYAGTA